MSLHRRGARARKGLRRSDPTIGQLWLVGWVAVALMLAFGFFLPDPVDLILQAATAVVGICVVATWGRSSRQTPDR